MLPVELQDNLFWKVMRGFPQVFPRFPPGFPQVFPIFCIEVIIMVILASYDHPMVNP